MINVHISARISYKEAHTSPPAVAPLDREKTNFVGSPKKDNFASVTVMSICTTHTASG